jgi:hypothetical protein
LHQTGNTTPVGWQAEVCPPPHLTFVVLERTKIEEEEEVWQIIIKIKSILKNMFASRILQSDQ